MRRTRDEALGDLKEFRDETVERLPRGLSDVEKEILLDYIDYETRKAINYIWSIYNSNLALGESLTCLLEFRGNEPRQKEYEYWLDNMWGRHLNRFPKYISRAEEAVKLQNEQERILIIVDARGY